jgi:hypothetical protein
MYIYVKFSPDSIAKGAAGNVKKISPAVNGAMAPHV